MLHAKLFIYYPALPCHSIVPGKKLLYPYSPLSEGIDIIHIYIYIYTYFSFKNLFYHPSLLYQPMLLGGVDVACQTVRLSSCIALSFHTTRESSYSTLIHPFAGFLDIFLSRNSSIILHSIYPCFWEGSGCCMPNSLFILHCPVISNY